MLLAVVACKGEEEHGHELPESCQDIDDLCHEAEENGVEGAAECHEIEHGGDEAECDAERDACLATCEPPGG